MLLGYTGIGQGSGGVCSIDFYYSFVVKEAQIP